MQTFGICRRNAECGAPNQLKNRQSLLKSQGKNASNKNEKRKAESEGQLWCEYHGHNPTHDTSQCKVIMEQAKRMRQQRDAQPKHFGNKSWTREGTQEKNIPAPNSPRKKSMLWLRVLLKRSTPSPLPRKAKKYRTSVQHQEIRNLGH